MDNLEVAYRKARRGKGWKRNVKKFEEDITGNLLKIQEILLNRTYHTSTYQTKKVFEPKERTIYVLPFYPDRLIQHAIMNILEPIWDKLFIHDSYACRKNKGIHVGSLRVMDFIRKNNYCLQCDISKFYPSMNHDVLYKIVQKKIKCKDTLCSFMELMSHIHSNLLFILIFKHTFIWIINNIIIHFRIFCKRKIRHKRCVFP